MTKTIIKKTRYLILSHCLYSKAEDLQLEKDVCFTCFLVSLGSTQAHHNCLHLLHTHECISVSLQPLFEEDTDLTMAFPIHKQMCVPLLNSLETPHTTQPEFKPVWLCSSFTGLLCFSLHDR